MRRCPRGRTLLLLLWVLAGCARPTQSAPPVSDAGPELYDGLLLECSEPGTHWCKSAVKILGANLGFSVITLKPDVPPGRHRFLGNVQITNEVGGVDESGLPTRLMFHVHVEMMRGRPAWQDLTVAADVDAELLEGAERSHGLAMMYWERRGRTGAPPESGLGLGSLWDAAAHEALYTLPKLEVEP